MIDKKKQHSSAVPNPGRHQAACRVCSHPQRKEIEEAFVSWRSPAKIAKQYKIRDRSSIYRHAHSSNLFPKRARNLRGALERLIEKVDDVPVTAAAIVAAVTTYARLNSQGQLVERSEQLNLNELFDRMTPDELEDYVKDGELPEWFPLATGQHGSEGAGDE